MGCPYRTAEQLVRLDDKYPEEMKYTINVEKRMQEHYPTHFLHRSRLPLQDVIDKERLKYTKRGFIVR